MLNTINENKYSVSKFSVQVVNFTYMRAPFFDVLFIHNSLDLSNTKKELIKSIYNTDNFENYEITPRPYNYSEEKINDLLSTFQDRLVISNNIFKDFFLYNFYNHPLKKDYKKLSEIFELGTFEDPNLKSHNNKMFSKRDAYYFKAIDNYLEILSTVLESDFNRVHEIFNRSFRPLFSKRKSFTNYFLDNVIKLPNGEKILNHFLDYNKDYFIHRKDALHTFINLIHIKGYSEKINLIEYQYTNNFDIDMLNFSEKKIISIDIPENKIKHFLNENVTNNRDLYYLTKYTIDFLEELTNCKITQINSKNIDKPESINFHIVVEFDFEFTKHDFFSIFKTILNQSSRKKYIINVNELNNDLLRNDLSIIYNKLNTSKINFDEHLIPKKRKI